MTPDDPRHGTEAGHEQHWRDNEDPCPPCYRAKILAARRRTKRKSMGYQYQKPIGDLWHKIDDLVQRGATHDLIAEWAGISGSQVFRAHKNGPQSRVYARTWLRLANMREGEIVTPIGITRRIQALHWLGYSANQIAEAAGCHFDTIRDARDEPRDFLAAKVRAGIVAAYDKLCMVEASGETRQLKAGVSRAKNMARRNGWVPPLGWESIDHDPTPPTDWEYRPGDRAGILRDLNDRHAGIDEACRITKRSRDSLQKWCANNGLSDLYRQLAARDAKGVNGYTKEAS